MIIELDYILVAVLWLVLFPIMYYILYDKIFHLGIYHALSVSGKSVHSVLVSGLFKGQCEGICNLDHVKTESLFEKYIEVLKCNVYISLALLFTFYFTLHGLMDSAFDSKKAFFMSLEISIIIIFWLRIQANPIKQFVQFIYHICHMKEISEVYPVIVRYKERTLEFYHHFITGSVVILFSEMSYYVLTNRVISYELDAHTSALLVVIYIICILGTTLITEKILDCHIWEDPNHPISD